MTAKKEAMLPQVKALQTTDLSPLIRMAGFMLPRLLGGFLPSLDEKQKNAFDKILPLGGEKKIYLHLMGTPTPPIVVAMAQPPTMSTVSEDKVRQQGIKGIRLTVDDLQPVLAAGLTPGTMLKLGWRLKGQIFTILGMLPTFWPLLRLGPAGLKDLGNKMASHFKPLLDLLPHP